MTFSSWGTSMLQTVWRSPPTTGNPSLHLNHYMWVSWWTTQGMFFLGCLLFSPAPNFILPFLHSHLIQSFSFHFIHPCDGASGLEGRHPTVHKPSIMRLQRKSELVSINGREDRRSTYLARKWASLEDMVMKREKLSFHDALYPSSAVKQRRLTRKYVSATKCRGGSWGSWMDV